MNNEALTYRDYKGSIEYDLENGVLFGSVQSVSDILLYEAETLSALTVAFHESVDDYLETCAEIGKS
jgi:predicted HicB family RNase H-like nuclease